MISLLKAYSPSGDTSEALNILARILKEANLEIEIDNYGILTCVGDREPTILLCGHVDTVPGQLPVTMHKGIISGRGVVDAKGPLAAMTCAFIRLTKNVRESVYFAVVSDEESEKGLGTKVLLKKLPKSIRYGIVGEPTRGRGIAVSYHGRLSFWLVVKGKAMHASASIAKANAIEACFQLYSAIKKELEQELGKIPVCPTIIHGGNYSSSLPELCKIHVDLRIPPGFSIREAMQIILNEIEKFRRKERNLKFDIILGSFVEPFSVNPDNILVKVFFESIKNVMGTDPILIRKLGTSDFNLIGKIFGIPVVAYGPGNPRLSHTNIERILVSEYLSSINVFERAVRTLSVRCNLNEQYDNG